MTCPTFQFVVFLASTLLTSVDKNRLIYGEGDPEKLLTCTLDSARRSYIISRIEHPTLQLIPADSLANPYAEIKYTPRVVAKHLFVLLLLMSAVVAPAQKPAGTPAPARPPATTNHSNKGDVQSFPRGGWQHC